MKKITMAFLTLAAMPLMLLAQEDTKLEKEGRPLKKETQEIIIRQNGKDKDIKLNVEINGDEVTINGKPLSEFKDKNITINKRKMIITDGSNKMQWNFSTEEDGMERFKEVFDNNFSLGDIEGGGGNSAFLGVTTEPAEGGVLIKEVVKGSAAEKAGLKKGDVIVKVGNEAIPNPEVLTDVICFKKPKDEVKIVYKRDGKQSTAKATLGSRKMSTTRSFSFGGPGGGDMRTFSFPPTPRTPGTNMEGFNEDLLEMQEGALARVFPRQKKIGLKIQDTEEGGGVKVINVEDSSAAATAGIKQDDIIVEINGTKIDNTDDAREELVPDEDKKLYKIKVKRAGSELNFDVKIPRKLKTANL